MSICNIYLYRTFATQANIKHCPLDTSDRGDKGAEESLASARQNWSLIDIQNLQKRFLDGFGIRPMRQNRW